MIRLKFLRLSRHFSQWEVAKQASMSQGRYSMIERGLIPPTPNERAALAALFEVSGATLFRSVVRDRPGARETGQGAPLVSVS